MSRIALSILALTTSLLAQQDYIKASNTDAGDQLGYSIAISGDTAVVGAFREASSAIGVNSVQNDNAAPGSGAVYVFVRSGGSWVQQAYIKASNTDSSDQFGYTVAISGDTIVVGANGEDGSATGVNGLQNDNSAPAAGAAYVFVRNAGAWSQQAYLKASNTDAGDQFGESVAIDGDTIVVGAWHESSSSAGVGGTQSDNSASRAGAAYVFVRSGSVWTQQAYLKASNPAADDEFGESVAVSADTIVVGAGGEDSGATGVGGAQGDNSASAAGAAYVFERSGSTWSQQAYLKASNTDAADEFGAAVSIAGDTVVVGASREDSSATGVDGVQNLDITPDAGAAYVFTRSGPSWSQQAYLKASNTDTGDLFGHSVSISGDTVLVGAYAEAGGSTGFDGDEHSDNTSGAGAVYVFVRDGVTWGQQSYVKATNTGAFDRFGTSVSVSGDSACVGARFESSSATGIGGNGSDNGAGSSGAAYAFRVCGPDDALEDNDSCNTAVSLPVGETTGLKVFGAAYGLDEDYYSVVLQPGAVLDLDVRFDTSRGNIDVYLYESGIGCHNESSYIVAGLSSTDDESLTWSNTTTVPKVYTVVIDANGAGFGCNTYDLEVELTDGSGCAGTGAPILIGEPSSALPFVISCPTPVSPCLTSPVIVFGACSTFTIPIAPPLGCGLCGLIVSPSWGTFSNPALLSAGLPIGFEFCVQCGCISSGACIELSQGLKIVVGP